MTNFLTQKIKAALPDKFKLHLKKILKIQKEYDYCLYVESIDFICNLKCVYCNVDITSKTGKIKENRLDFQPLLKILNEVDKTFLIAISGNGEPFLLPDIIDNIIEVTKKHYVSIVSNFTTENIPEFCERVSPKRIKSIIASLHPQELERKKLTDKYINNFILCREKGFNVDPVIVAYPGQLSEILKKAEFFKQRGVDVKFAEFNGEYEGKKYPGAYTHEQRKELDLGPFIKEKWFQKGKLCNAGFNIGFVHYDGVVFPCTQVKSFSLGNLEQGIQFREKLLVCPLEECRCPINYFDYYLFEKALNKAAK
jgi:MoaA/NifB/PqqE/SkfB family radical SAM enzyme